MISSDQKQFSLHHIDVNEDMKEIKQHGNVGFPLAIYPVEFSQKFRTRIRWHWHNELELIYVVKGQARFLVAETEFILKAGQGLFINTNTMHSVAESEGFCCTYYSVVFHSSLLLGSMESALSSKYLGIVLNSPDLRYLMLDNSIPEHTQILSHLHNLVQLDAADVFAYELECKVQLLEMWVHLLKHLYHIHDTISSRHPKQSLDELRAKEAINYIESHFAEPITLDDIAAAVHISTSECCRCFKRCIKLSPFEYLMRYRIIMSTNLIQQEKTASISSVASRTGFNSSSYFNKLFRKYIGCTPTEYRKEPAKHQASRDHFLIPFT